MSIAIVSTKTGSGHNSVMKTIEEEFKKQNYHDVYMLPTFYEDILFSNRIMSEFYNFLLMSSIELCTKFSELANTKYTRPDILEDYNHRYEKILELVKMEGLECIVSTSHSINNSIIKVLNETNLLDKIPFYIVVTDPFDPIAAGFDVPGAVKYFCATETVKEILIKAGVEISRIQVIDYPVSSRFIKKYSDTEKKLVYEKMGLLFHKPTILLNSGASGSSHYFELLKLMLDCNGDYQIIIICGKNKTMYEMAYRLKEQNKQAAIKVLGFVDNIEEILQISDIAVTKAGANTFFECLYCETPVIIDGIHGLMYQERGVIDYLRDYGVGVLLNDSRDLPELLDYLFSNGLIEQVKTNIKNLTLKNGTSKIVHTILNDLNVLNGTA